MKKTTKKQQRDTVKTHLRLPAHIHSKLVRFAGARTEKAGRRVSLNEVVVRACEYYLGEKVALVDGAYYDGTEV